MSRFPYLFCISCIAIVMLLSGCGAQPTQVVQALHPIQCHREAFVGIIYVTLENDGTDAGTSSMHISYTVGGAQKIPVSIQVQLPLIPAQTQRMVMVQVPVAIPGALAATDTTHYRSPEGHIVIQLSNKSGDAKQSTSTFPFNC